MPMGLGVGNLECQDLKGQPRDCLVLPGPFCLCEGMKGYGAHRLSVYKHHEMFL